MSVKPLAAPGGHKVVSAPLRPHDVPLECNRKLPYHKYLLTEHLTENSRASARDSYDALARAIRDKLTPAWVQTEAAYRESRAKRVYYLSMEYLIGRSLTKNVTNMGIEELVRTPGRSQSGVGRGLGHHPASLGLYQPHAPARGHGEVALALLQGHHPPAPGADQGDQPPAMRPVAQEI